MELSIALQAPRSRAGGAIVKLARSSRRGRAFTSGDDRPVSLRIQRLVPVCVERTERNLVPQFPMCALRIFVSVSSYRPRHSARGATIYADTRR